MLNELSLTVLNAVCDTQLIFIQGLTMFPFSINKKTLNPTLINASINEHSNYELVTFDREKINLFAARVQYCQPHWHESPEFIYVLKGAFTFTLNQETLTLQKGGMIYILHDVIHSLQATEQGSELITVQFSPHLFSDIHQDLPICYRLCNETLYTPKDHAVKQALIDLARHNLHTSDLTDYYKMSLIYRLLDILNNAGEQIHTPQLHKKDEKIIKQAIEYINENYQHEMTLSDIAQQFGVSYHYFSKLFKKISGHNFKEYITAVRINKAKFLLKNTHIPITEISQACGFNEHKHLIVAFKKISNMTPTEYRKKTLSMSSQDRPDSLDFCAISLTEALLDSL